MKFPLQSLCVVAMSVVLAIETGCASAGASSKTSETHVVTGKDGIPHEETKTTSREIHGLYISKDMPDFVNAAWQNVSSNIGGYLMTGGGTGLVAWLLTKLSHTSAQKKIDASFDEGVSRAAPVQPLPPRV